MLESLYNGIIRTASSTRQQAVTQADGSMIVSAQMSLDEIQALGLLNDIERSPTEEYYTLAGYLLAHLDAIPRQGESIDTGSYICTVLGMHGQRIDQVAIKKKEL